jgi:hypothetical protein
VCERITFAAPLLSSAQWHAKRKAMLEPVGFRFPLGVSTSDKIYRQAASQLTKR